MNYVWEAYNVVVVDDDNLTKPESKVETELGLEAYSPSLCITIY